MKARINESSFNLRPGWRSGRLDEMAAARAIENAGGLRGGCAFSDARRCRWAGRVGLQVKVTLSLKPNQIVKDY